MILLLTLSAFVSLITLGVLLFERNKPSTLNIPSAFLGTTQQTSPAHLRITRPPWLLWLLVILATLGAVLAFKPWPLVSPTQNRAGFSALLWVDPTFSTKLSTVETPPDLNALAEQALSTGNRLFGLQQKNEGANAENPLGYQIVPLSSAVEITNYLRAEFDKPASGFARPLDITGLSKILATTGEFANRDGSFLAVSDAQRETLLNTLALAPFFSSGRLLSLAVPSSLSGKRDEIIPSELFELWQEPKKGTGLFSEFNSEESHIPLNARPGFFRESWAFKKDRNFEIVTRGSSTLDRPFPMITACSEQISGPAEIDAFADLRALGRFFGAAFRFEDCTEHKVVESETVRDPWKFRPQSIWVVPANDDVLNTLSSQSEFWLPKGFKPESDALVYVANSVSSGTLENSRLMRVPLALDAGSGPTSYLLSAPPPPSEILLAQQNKDRTDAAKFQPIFSAADKTPLGYQAGNLPIFFLRTPVAMPNGELGRSSEWSHFWIKVSQSLRPDVGAVSTLGTSDIESILKNPEQLAQLNKSHQKSLNPRTLSTEPASSESKFSPGIYENSEGQIFYVNLPPSERSRDFMSAVDYESQWTNRAATEKSAQKTTRTPPAVWSVVGGTGALIFVCGLWFYEFLQGRNKKKVTTLTLLLFAFFVPTVSLLNLPRAKAQGNELSKEMKRLFPNFNRRVSPTLDPGKSISVPYRVSWCDASIPTGVAEKYKTLRDTLANRGTIDMPETLLAGQCRPGASEIWWTDAAAAIDGKIAKEHLSGGGVIVLEGASSGDLPVNFAGLADASVGLIWEVPKKRGLLYRSFYLIPTFDGCANDGTRLLTLRKKINAHSPVVVATGARFLTAGRDCFATDDDYRTRSFVNLMYSFLATDYKEDQLQLPEILARVRNLGLEP